MQTANNMFLVLFLVSGLSVTSSEKESSRRLRKRRDVSAELDLIKQTLETLSRQVMDQQTFAEEKIRSDGDSGIKQMRRLYGGTKSYHSAAHAEDSMSAIHEHANQERTVGMGEIIAVLNGVEFRTRHNDFKLVMPSSKSTHYHATEPIPFPPVPPSVLSTVNINNQIEKMKEYFLAFKEQDPSIVDYRPFFRPVLCYLEGAWTRSIEDMQEPFPSDNHFVDAYSWKDLEQKNRFNIHSGRKEPDENYAYHPRKIVDVTEDGLPVIAQWNYRILCHPLKDDMPTNRLRVVDDLGCRMAQGRNLSQHENSRQARFQLNPDDQDIWEDKITDHTFLDELMEKIPGKNNYGASLGDWAYGTPVRQTQLRDRGYPLVKNTGFYHRYYRVNKVRGRGTVTERRSFSDSNVFMAMTDHPEIAPTNLELCNEFGCSTETQRWSYAIPLEIIYTTPLFTWNPYRLVNKGDFQSSLGQTVRANGQDGSSPQKAFDGINTKTYYMTPAEFIDQKHTTPADTSFEEVYIKDSVGKNHHVAGSGQRIFVNIPGVGKIRLRYPIVPVHGEGSATWKEVDAIKDIMLHSNKYSKMFQEPINCKCT